MIQVNQGDFIAWVQGDLLIRDASGRCLVGDNINHEKAKAAMDRGEAVGLMVTGEVISTMRLTSKGYIERAVWPGTRGTNRRISVDLRSPGSRTRPTGNSRGSAWTRSRSSK